MGAFFLATPNYMDDPLTDPLVGGGSWNPSFPLTNIGSEFFIQRIISTGVTRANTQFEINFQQTRDIKVIAIPNSNISTSGKVRVQGSSTVAWTGLTTNGTSNIGDTSLAVTATGNKDIRAGQMFGIDGFSDPLYKVTADLALGENKLRYSEAMNNAVWQYNLGGASHTVTANQEAPDGTTNAVQVQWVSGGIGLFRQDTLPSISAGSTYNASLWVKLVAITRSSGANTIQLDIGDGTVVTFNESQTPLNTWVNVSTDIVAGSAGSWFDIQAGANVTSYTIQVWKAGLTTGSGVKDIVKTTSAAVNTSIGTLSLVKEGTASGGLDIGYTSGYGITCYSGKFPASLVFDTDWQNYYSATYPYGTRTWGSSGVWSGVSNPAELNALGIPKQFVYVLSNFQLCQYIKVMIADTSNSDGYVALDDIMFCSAFTPANNMSYGTSFGLKSNSSKVGSVGGGDVTNREKSQRTAGIRLENITVTEAFANVFDVVRELDITRTGYFLYDSEDTMLRNRRTFPFRLESLITLNHVTYDTVTTDISLLERLA